MDKKLFELGISKRKSTLGADYVEKNLASADDFNLEFQQQMTEWCWGFG
ncbi:MAG TPA: 4-carboxymuconolactone decarboxylase, partial [Gammaproteobacteria bacterium]|nr:4-carboxymuconolactone decarboxylase [Gammaproteobacteria bacterium]